MTLKRWYIGDRPFIIATCDRCGVKQSDHGAPSVFRGRIRFASVGWRIVMPTTGRRAVCYCPACVEVGVAP